MHGKPSVLAMPWRLYSYGKTIRFQTTRFTTISAFRFRR